MENKAYKKKLRHLRLQDWLDPEKTFAPESRVKEGVFNKEDDIRYWLAQLAMILRDDFQLSLRGACRLMGVNPKRISRAIKYYPIKEIQNLDDFNDQVTKLLKEEGYLNGEDGAKGPF